MYYNQMAPGYDFYPGQAQMGQPGMYRQVPMGNAPKIDPRALETPTITLDGGFRPSFTIAGTANEQKAIIPVDPLVPDVEKVSKKRGRPKKEPNGEETAIVRAKETPANGAVTVEDTPTAYTYMETTGMLRETLMQIDSLSAELVNEFESVKHSRTMKNKYNTLVGLSENVGALLSTKIAAIREINSAITKSNDLDYKKNKDRRAAEADVNDDKYVADLYKSFISQPQNMGYTPQMPAMDPNVYGSGIVRAELHSGNYNTNGPVDASYLNYVSNLTPEQNLMMYENNPNVKQVVVWDKSTDNKFFQMMDVSTGQVIPNVPVYDADMFMQDTIIDLNTMIAKNTNLNQTFPVVVINEDPVLSQY